MTLLNKYSVYISTFLYKSNRRNGFFLMCLVLYLFSLPKITFGDDDIMFVHPDFLQSYQNKEIIPQNVSNTGSTSLGIPIIVPPGRAGMQPEIALNYGGSGSNGIVGVGWDLELGSIQRSTKKGLDYEGTEFIAAINGSSVELVPRGEWGTGYYGAKIESDFTKFNLVSSNGSSGWVATTREGIKYFYGRTSSSRQDDPDESSNIYKWCLDRVEDPNGNYMEFTYTKDENQIYPSRIRYTGNEPSLTPANEVVFDYFTSRPDAWVQYNTKFGVITERLLRYIDVYGNGERATKYDLRYETGISSGRSRLKQVFVNSLPARTFQYQEGGTGGFVNKKTYALSAPGGTLHFADVNGDAINDLIHYYNASNNLYISIANGDGTFQDAIVKNLPSLGDTVNFADINGDGLSDLLYYDIDAEDLYVYLATVDVDDGSFSFEFLTSKDLAFQGVYTVHFADINGDGLADLLHYDNSAEELHVYLATINGNTFSFESKTTLDLATSGVYVPYFADINGDGLADFLHYDNSAEELHIYLATGDSNCFSYVETMDLGTSGVYELFFSDVNGDGLSDLLHYNDPNKRVDIYFSTGNGHFTSMVSSTVLDTELGGVYFLDVSDVNGDGKADLVYYDKTHDTTDTFISKGDGTFKNPIHKTFNHSADSIYMVDISGDGVSDLVSFTKYTSDVDIVTYLSDSPGTIDLLKVTDNGVGATSTIEYEYSSNYDNYLLPFVVNTVKSIAVDDGNNTESITSYTYAGGYYDIAERDFRGFETVTKTNPDDTIVETIYIVHDDWGKGKINQIDVWTPEKVDHISQTIQEWNASPIQPQPNICQFVHLDQRDIKLFNNPEVGKHEFYGYNDNGLLSQVITTGTDAGRIYTAYNYFNYGDWLWRTATEYLQGESSGLVRETIKTYETGTGNQLTEEYWHSSFSYETGLVNPKIEMTYDPYGNLEDYEDAKNSVTTTTYDSTYTLPYTVTKPETNGISHVTTNDEYDYKFGKVKKVINENGFITEYSYEPQLGRPSEILNRGADGTSIIGQQIFEYDDDVFPRVVTTKILEQGSNQYIVKNEYLDGLGRKIKETTTGEDGKTIVTDYYYDEMGRNYRTRGPYFDNSSDPKPWTQTYYDSRGRIDHINTSHETQGTVTTQYYYSGLTTRVKDPDDKQKAETKDYLGRIIRVTEYTEEGEKYTNYSYNDAGDLMTVTDARGNVLSFSYDSLGRKRAMNDPDMGRWSYTYDPNGNLKTQSDPKRQTITLEYDQLNRLISKGYSNGDPTVTYNYDTSINGIGLLHSASNGIVTTLNNSYDEMGRVKSLSKTISGGGTYNTLYWYDLSGKVTDMQFPDGYQVSYDYFEGTGLIDTVTGSDDVQYAKFSSYSPTGKIGNIIFNNNINFSTTYQYYPESTRLKSITTKNSSGNLLNYNYIYTKAGDVDSITDNAKGITRNYTYDSLHRLTGEFLSGNVPTPTKEAKIMEFVYDEGDKPHAVKTVIVNDIPYSYQYDENGNLEANSDFSDSAQVADRDIYYNADNKPSRIEYINTSTVTTNFLYDGDGERAKKTVSPSGSTTYYIDDSYEVKDGVSTKYIFAGNLRIAQVTGSTVTYLHKDHLGSSTLTTDPAGTIIEQAEYKPYGGERWQSGTQSTDYKFTDQELDRTTGLYNYDARLYDPVIGRFLSVDTVIPDFYNPQALNPYTYCLNNPLIYEDPSGHFYQLAMVGMGPAGWVILGGTTIFTMWASTPQGHETITATWNKINDFFSDDGEVSEVEVSTKTGGKSSGEVEKGKEGNGETQNQKEGNGSNVNQGNSESDSSTLDDILNGATPGEQTKGRTKQYDKEGGFDQANKDFDNLGPSDIHTYPNGTRVGTLPDGRKVNVRPKSTPTVEVQSGKNKIKIRYH